MEEKHKITAISGWAIPRTWYAEQIQKAFPYSNIQVIYPENPENEEEAKYLLNQYQSQLYIGYSLGSLWLLKHHIYLPQNCDKAILAPILAFLNTSNLGGKTSEGQLKYLIKILNDSSSKKEVLKDFFFFHPILGKSSRLYILFDIFSEFELQAIRKIIRVMIIIFFIKP